MSSDSFAVRVSRPGAIREIVRPSLTLARATLAVALKTYASLQGVTLSDDLRAVMDADAAAAEPGETIQCGNALFSIVRKSGLDYV